MQSLHRRLCPPIRENTSAVLLPVIILATAVLASGCSDIRGDEPLAQSVVIQVQTKAGGVWIGTLTDDLTGQSYELGGVVREDHQEGRFLTDGGPLFRLRDIVGTDGDLSATIAASTAGPEETFEDGSSYTSGVLTAFVTERTRIEGTWSLDSGETGTLTLAYDDIYERGSDIARLAGTWECSWGDICNIDVLGEIFGQGEGGCVATGRIAIIDASYNIYEVTYGNSCLMSGQLSGLGVLADEFGTNDAFVIMLDPVTSFFYTDVFLRQ